MSIGVHGNLGGYEGDISMDHNGQISTSFGKEKVFAGLTQEQLVIVGVSVGVAVLLIILLTLCCCCCHCCCFKKRRETIVVLPGPQNTVMHQILPAHPSANPYARLQEADVENKY